MERKQLRKLLDSLSLEEKIGQLIQLSGDFYQAQNITTGPQQQLGITQQMVDLSGSVLNVTGAAQVKRVQEAHLKKGKHPIPLLFMADIIYGYRTVYPIPLGIGATWDPQLVETAYRNTADEASASGADVTFAPMLDLVRDPRWGRVLESTGEDVTLNSRFAEAMVHGFQQDLSAGAGLVACIKHFAGYGAVEAGREYNSADIAKATLLQNYLPAYHAAVNAGAKMVMASLSTLNGVPSTADKWLLDDVLRQQWGFNGVVISDYASIQELVAHGFAKDHDDAAQRALEAGVDIDMKSPCYANGLKHLLAEGKLNVAKIDQAAWRVLSLKNDLGLFEDPFRGASTQRESRSLLTPQKRDVARKLSREAIVLLKNQKDTLPLSKHQQKIAVIGPYADNQDLVGLWAVHAHRDDTVTLAAGIKEKLPASAYTIAKGTDILRDSEFFERFGTAEESASREISSDEVEEQHRRQALDAAAAADVIIFACGEHPLQSSEAGSRVLLRLPENQMTLFAELVKLRKPIVTIVFSGRPLVLTDIVARSSAVLQAWFPGTEGGHALADILFGDYNPSGRLSMSMPYIEGQIPIHYDHLATGRPEKTSQHHSRFVSRYLDAPTEPLFPFGYGLSYGKVAYQQLILENATVHAGQTVNGFVEVHNVGQWDRDEVVQFYFHDQVASVVQPVKRLVDFKRVPLAAGETKQVRFSIPIEKFGFYDRDGKFCLEPGAFTFFAGADSTTQLAEEFELVK